MSTYALPKRYDLKGFGHSHDGQIEGYQNESRERRVDGHCTVATPTFANDVGTN